MRNCSHSSVSLVSKFQKSLGVFQGKEQREAGKATVMPLRGAKCELWSQNEAGNPKGQQPLRPEDPAGWRLGWTLR